MTSVTVGPIVAEVTGDGFPVVMIHGLGGTSNMFQPQLASLNKYRVIRMDLPGSGRSQLPGEPLSIESMCTAVARAMDGTGAARAHFVGHSMGTLVCQRMAVAAPERVASLTLFGALAEPADAVRTGLAARAALARSGGMSDIADQIMANALSSYTIENAPAVVAFVRESITRQNPESYARTCEALAKATAVDPSRISAPALLVTGDADMVNMPGVARALADAIKGATYSGLDRCGHWATVEAAAESSRKLAEFLRLADR
jgi:3-oxoadipate enol-lactonase